MIKINTLTDSDIGRFVEYRGSGGEKEIGRIKSWNDKFIFVVYPGNNQAKNEHYDRYTAAATLPENLFFIKDSNDCKHNNIAMNYSNVWHCLNCGKKLK